MTAAALPFAIAALFLGAALVPLAARSGRAAAAWSSAAALAAAALLLAPLAPAALAGEVTVFRHPWLPDWGLDLTFRFDGLGLLFAILILGIGQLIILYAAYYMPKEDGLGRLYGLLLAFAGGMLGVVLAENLLLLVIFWEITSLSSFLLIAYKREAPDARIAARMAIAVTGGGGLALLAGVLLLGRMTGSFELSVVLAAGDRIRADALYPVVLVLVLLGVFTKSAQVPFHFWLPNAMAAPTPVSAYLHSATMVKAGVFLLGRLYPALSGTELWFVLVGGTGAVTLAYGAYLALLKHDLKGLLAYSTVSHLGLVTFLFGLETPLSPVAAVFHIINHAIFKASLFMAAGIIDHECGTRDMRRINGLFRYMPHTAVLGMVAAGSMAGVPLLNGFLSKEMFFAETVERGGALGDVLPVFATIAGILSVAYSARFIHDVFFHGEPVDLPRQPHEPPRWMRLPVEVLVVLCLLLGLAPAFTIDALLHAASAAVLAGPVPAYELAIWHGFNLPLVMSIVALLGGLLYYWRRATLFALQERFAPRLTSPVAFERVFNFAVEASQRIMALLDTVSLQRYLALLVLAALAAGGFAWLGAPAAGLAGGPVTTPADPVAVGALLALVLGCTGAAFHHRRRLIAIVFLSVVGLIVSLAFIRFAAPDLALTQLSVEVVTIVLLLLSLRFLPGEAPQKVSPARNARDIAIAIAAGGGAAALALAMLTRPFETISGYFLENSVPGGGGTNVVNVILVDFRGFDTLGETTVIALAAVIGWSLLGPRGRERAERTPAHAAPRAAFVLEFASPLFFRLLVLLSIVVLLRGHDEIGGGFVGGLTASLAFAIVALAQGVDEARRRLRLSPLTLAGGGLLLAVASGLPGLVTHGDYLRHLWFELHAGSVQLEQGTTLLFDLGVYLAVLGTVLTFLFGLAQEAER